ncbi:hypothetical protein [Mycolicibacterium aubagnense]|uniref:Peptidase M41 domain-containing protein n=1 Tax=Mycolicibacterium aubagnense TaxID=319707 RepID=A0ABM7IA07_9MYCO|nr:hypothetical protein [Mycolicibacterium aubagnense]TLH59574.1 hypothetical protein C1S80_18890 [Mycolicibacterium aubagnense]WGI34582.1 hypothetical protein QDT91_09685 [Mycolicibacterium aubagnense]BBX83541.1 hypothetical protein MAUB_14140 [Mycolicibacterium aubagnense]
MTPGLFRDPVLRTAVHESAHGILAAVHGRTVNFAEILTTPATSWGGKPLKQHAAGITTYRADGRAITEHDALVAAAGAAGESIWDYGQPTLSEVLKALSAHTHDHDDVMHLSHRAGENPAAVVQRLLPLVDRLWRPIADLAFELKKRHRVEHQDVLAALGIPSAEDAHRYTAAIRAGAEPGSLSVGRMMF